MNYKKIYDNLISKGRNRVLNCYVERHHIIPKCMGGTDDKENLVELTPEEHYVAHQLLVKIYPENKILIHAAVMMIPNRPSNKLYGWLRRKLSERMKESQAGSGNSQYGKRWIHNKELKESKRIPKNDYLPEGWEEGRILDFDAKCEREKKKELRKQRSEELRKQRSEEKTRKRIKTKHLMFRKTDGYRRAKSIRLYEEFKESNLSLRKFASKKGMVPMTLSKWFREFIPEYDIEPRKAANKQIKLSDLE